MLSISSWPTCVAVIVLANHADFNIILPRATERERESSFDIAISLSRSTASYSSETTSERKKKKKNTIPKNTLSNLFIHLFSSPRFSKRKEYIATWGEKIALFESERDGVRGTVSHERSRRVSGSGVFALFYPVPSTGYLLKPGRDMIISTKFFAKWQRFRVSYGITIFQSVP